MNAQAHLKHVQASICGVLHQTICLGISVPVFVRSSLCGEFLSMIEVNWSSWVLFVKGAGAKAV
jgi:hypothetical protein